MLARLVQRAFDLAQWFVAHATLPGEGKAERKRRLAAEEQRRVLRDWAASAQPGDPVPDFGFRCERCGYPLAGLARQNCPECGRDIVS